MFYLGWSGVQEGAATTDRVTVVQTLIVFPFTEFSHNFLRKIFFINKFITTILTQCRCEKRVNAPWQQQEEKDKKKDRADWSIGNQLNHLKAKAENMTEAAAAVSQSEIEKEAKQQN